MTYLCRNRQNTEKAQRIKNRPKHIWKLVIKCDIKSLLEKDKSLNKLEQWIKIDSSLKTVTDVTSVKIKTCIKSKTLGTKYQTIMIPGKVEIY